MLYIGRWLFTHYVISSFFHTAKSFWDSPFIAWPWLGNIFFSPLVLFSNFSRCHRSSMWFKGQRFRCRKQEASDWGPAPTATEPLLPQLIQLMCLLLLHALRSCWPLPRVLRGYRHTLSDEHPEGSRQAVSQSQGWWMVSDVCWLLMLIYRINIIYHLYHKKKKCNLKCLIVAF